ncbi:hypothetical protein TVAG_128730 [Trichomonas vaginalis G3]|uniref:Uncharacterized protein n=1 Tax=Trichomonas vaginalis (strain ATCC PRA-98 / G3) TaxID=412133 RepID=A2E4C4_TRIV3|nr:hypothetical protein TVAGG3_0018340 [Trichomonas vaginalis G3]EAY12459.1 hypothetical protein TVAG_128730 [Trichomonas vaginalis G3]KAI5539518.1 hypothetical protein TVAGG3_0018340 [Trichomonas vaginalis G3]|eukprot:XP_001324682.1 hypothetical protein [Trichomonas vaginalis G3]
MSTSNASTGSEITPVLCIDFISDCISNHPELLMDIDDYNAVLTCSEAYCDSISHYLRKMSFYLAEKLIQTQYSLGTIEKYFNIVKNYFNFIEKQPDLAKKDEFGGFLKVILNSLGYSLGKKDMVEDVKVGNEKKENSESNIKGKLKKTDANRYDSSIIDEYVEWILNQTKNSESKYFSECFSALLYCVRNDAFTELNMMENVIDTALEYLENPKFQKTSLQIIDFLIQKHQHIIDYLKLSPALSNELEIQDKSPKIEDIPEEDIKVITEDQSQVSKSITEENERLEKELEELKSKYNINVDEFETLEGFQSQLKEHVETRKKEIEKNLMLQKKLSLAKVIAHKEVTPKEKDIFDKWKAMKEKEKREKKDPPSKLEKLNQISIDLLNSEDLKLLSVLYPLLLTLVTNELLKTEEISKIYPKLNESKQNKLIETVLPDILLLQAMISHVNNDFNSFQNHFNELLEIFDDIDEDKKPIVITRGIFVAFANFSFSYRIIQKILKKADSDHFYLPIIIEYVCYYVVQVLAKLPQKSHAITNKIYIQNFLKQGLNYPTLKNECERLIDENRKILF